MTVKQITSEKFLCSLSFCYVIEPSILASETVVSNAERAHYHWGTKRVGRYKVRPSRTRIERPQH